MTVIGKYLGMSQEVWPLFSVFRMNAVNPALHHLQSLTSQYGFVCHHLSTGKGLLKAGTEELVVVGGCCLPGLEAVAGSGSEVVARTLKNWAREEGGDSQGCDFPRRARASLEWKVDGEPK